VQGSFTVPEEVDGALQLTGDHTFVYALTPVSTDGTQQPTVLFTVRRQVVYRFTAADLAANRVELTTSATEAGPMACDAASAARYFTPVLPTTTTATAAASTKASPTASTAASASPTQAVVDPYDQSRSAWSLCGVMSGPTP
jgi:xanthine/CO dehydrogenase XdhC/CoxF family maturation factor